MAVDQAAQPSQPIDAIQSWQSNAGAGAGDEDTISKGIIGSLFDSIMGVLRCLLEHLDKKDLAAPAQSNFHYDTLEKISASFFFWGLDFGVSRGDLDEILQYSDSLRDTVLIVLVSIGQHTSNNLVSALITPEKRQSVLSTSHLNTLLEHARIILDEPEDTEYFMAESLEVTFQILRTKVQSLSILSSSLECPAEDKNDGEEARRWTESQDRAADQYYVDLVSERFPMAEKALAERLGRSNWNRYRHLQRQRERVQMEPEASIMKDSSESEFHDSGIGSLGPAQSVFASITRPTPARPQSEYASTVVSSRAEASHKRLPPLPEEARLGLPFVCEVCERRVRIRRTREWKKHVFRDICAYTCIFLECSSVGVLFEDREAMTCHMESHHGINQDTTSQLCPLCQEEITGARDVISLHFSRHLEELSLAVLPTSAGSDNESDASDSDPQEDAPPETTPAPHSGHMLLGPKVSEKREEGTNAENGENLALQNYEMQFKWLEQQDRAQLSMFTRKEEISSSATIESTHMYGCTFPRCMEKFGSKADWKRHEIIKHYQLEGYRCRFSTNHIVCGAYFAGLSGLEKFKKHLESQHGMTDPEAVLSEISRQRIGKNCQSQFWCGFCRNIIRLNARESPAFDERFNHIASHIENEGTDSDEWLCAELNMLKSQVSRDTSSTFPTKDSMESASYSYGDPTRQLDRSSYSISAPTTSASQAGVPPQPPQPQDNALELLPYPRVDLYKNAPETTLYPPANPAYVGSSPALYTTTSKKVSYLRTDLYKNVPGKALHPLRIWHTSGVHPIYTL
ncbi:hypothetical protein BCR34DRAFT_590863 [Clohesyomyces aquaticus]|uniref:C2H2-type domain-containing protein n=1 Tax=Clohesyomyces aquaticus TaxID=1231657 RepID=A0A1Y1Z6D3_9PLEO|nr:hypothetical protein BCR34DRAFT_590863 [Clohesyomyces aquaticus]